MADSMTATPPPAHAKTAQAKTAQARGRQEAQAKKRRRNASRPDTVASVAESFVGLQRTVRRSKARLLAAASNDVESATQVLLHTVAAEGPMRASALAASVQADLSTVSRQVAVLVSRGVLERQADQLDGRASLLAVTEAGRAAVAEHDQGRQAFFDEVLAGGARERCISSPGCWSGSLPPTTAFTPPG